MKILLFLFAVTLIGGAGNVAASTLSLKNIKLPAFNGVYKNYDIKTSSDALVLFTRDSEVTFMTRMTNYVEGTRETQWYTLSKNRSTLRFSDTSNWYFKTNIELKNPKWDFLAKKYDGFVENY